MIYFFFFNWKQLQFHEFGIICISAAERATLCKFGGAAVLLVAYPFGRSDGRGD